MDVNEHAGFYESSVRLRSAKTRPGEIRKLLFICVLLLAILGVLCYFITDQVLTTRNVPPEALTGVWGIRFNPGDQGELNLELDGDGVGTADLSLPGGADIPLRASYKWGKLSCDGNGLSFDGTVRKEGVKLAASGSFVGLNGDKGTFEAMQGGLSQ